MRDTLSADLLARHLATEAQVAEAYRTHDEDGGAFPTRLVQAGVRGGDVLMALARVCSLAPVPGSRLRFPERGIGAGLDPAPFWKLMAAPFGRVGDELLVAFADPATIPLAGPEGLPRHRAHVGLEADVRMALRALFSSAATARRIPTPVPPPGPPPTSEESETLDVELAPEESEEALALEVDEAEEASEVAAALVAEELGIEAPGAVEARAPLAFEAGHPAEQVALVDEGAAAVSDPFAFEAGHPAEQVALPDEGAAAVSDPLAFEAGHPAAQVALVDEGAAAVSDPFAFEVSEPIAFDEGRPAEEVPLVEPEERLPIDEATTAGPSDAFAVESPAPAAEASAGGASEPFSVDVASSGEPAEPLRFAVTAPAEDADPQPFDVAPPAEQVDPLAFEFEPPAEPSGAASLAARPSAGDAPTTDPSLPAVTLERIEAVAAASDEAFDSIDVALEEPPTPLDPALEAVLESPHAPLPSTPVAVVSFAARKKLVPGGAVRAPLETTPGPAQLIPTPSETPREERTGLWAMPAPPPEPVPERPRDERTGLWALPPPPPEPVPERPRDERTGLWALPPPPPEPVPERPRDERTGLWAMPAPPPEAPASASPDRTGIWELPKPPAAPATDRTGVWETLPPPGAPAAPSGPERTGIWAGATAAQVARAPAGPRVVGDALLPPDGAPSVAATQEKLAAATSEGDVASTLVTFAAAWFPRTLVFARREGELRGLLGRGLGRPSYEVAALRLQPALLPPGYGPGPIGPSLDALWRVYGGLPQALLVRELPAALGEPWLLLGDVPNVSARYHDLHPLELVLRSAGEALDRIIALR